MTKETDDKLVRRKWLEWLDFNHNWIHGSYDDTVKYFESLRPRTKEIHEAGIKWKILRRHSTNRYSFTPRFESHFKSDMKRISDANEETVTDGIKKGHVTTDMFVEYATVCTVVSYIGMEKEEYYNLPTKNPNKLRMLFEIAEMVYAIKDRQRDPEGWYKRAENMIAILRERREFRDRLRGGR